VAVLLGQSGFGRLHADSPFTRLAELLERLRRETPYVILDVHASATAEKLGLFAQADGLCSAVIGSHGRVQTADERVLSGGTAVICDAGRTGSVNSVGGTDIQSRIQEYLTGIPDWDPGRLGQTRTAGCCHRNWKERPGRFHRKNTYFHARRYSMKEIGTVLSIEGKRIGILEEGRLFDALGRVIR